MWGESREVLHKFTQMWQAITFKLQFLRDAKSPFGAKVNVLTQVPIC